MKTKTLTENQKINIFFRATGAYFKGRSLILLEPILNKWLKKLDLTYKYHIQVDLGYQAFTIYLVNNSDSQPRFYQVYYDPRG